eukprot:5501983-Alexandrium_andersonii.AAC.1
MLSAWKPPTKDLPTGGRPAGPLPVASSTRSQAADRPIRARSVAPASSAASTSSFGALPAGWSPA